jgi:hypothetical protein
LKTWQKKIDFNWIFCPKIQFAVSNRDATLSCHLLQRKHVSKQLSRHKAAIGLHSIQAYHMAGLAGIEKFSIRWASKSDDPH